MLFIYVILEIIFQ